MTIKDSEFFIWLITAGFEETTSQRFRSSYIAVMQGQYNPHMHMRYFKRGDVSVFFDLTFCSVGKKGKFITGFLIAQYQMPFEPDTKIDYLDIPDKILTYLLHGRLIQSRYISARTKQELYNRDNGICQECGNEWDIEIDHVKPVSKGGDSSIDNLQLLCKPCNRKKRDKY